MRRLGNVMIALCVAASMGCLVEAPESSPQTSQKISGGRNLVTGTPPLQLRSGAIFDDRVEVLGAKLDPGRAQPGDTVTITAYYKVLDAIPRDYLVFVHVEDVDGRLERVNVDHAPAGGQYPTSQWKKGETVQDTFTVSVPPGQNLRGLNVWMGFWYPPDDTRMQLKNPDKVRNDGRNRILLATLPVGY
ncbi:MAG: hypothetical protein IRZ16_05915 [Myxococcaceae bacterium]|nr:hypothetical protein [Myxococcaceae bacterium]